jgi:hypothetical protein
MALQVEVDLIANVSAFNEASHGVSSPSLLAQQVFPKSNMNAPPISSRSNAPSLPPPMNNAPPPPPPPVHAKKLGTQQERASHVSFDQDRSDESLNSSKKINSFASKISRSQAPPPPPPGKSAPTNLLASAVPPPPGKPKPLAASSSGTISKLAGPPPPP